MGELLTHPLFLLIIGAIFTGLVIPSVTRRSQERQKKLEIQTGFVSDMSECTIKLVQRIEGVWVMRSWAQRHPDDTSFQLQYERAFETMNSAYHEFRVDSAILGTKLEAYLHESSIPDHWTHFADSVMDFYALNGIPDPERYQETVAKIKSRLDIVVPEPQPDKPVHDEWTHILNRILKVKADLIHRLLSAELSLSGRPHSGIWSSTRRLLKSRSGLP